jgi:hypothetical protein
MSNRKESDMPDIRTSKFLHRALQADALMSGAAALLLLLGASVLEPLLGLPATLLRYAGAILVPFVVLVGFFATRSEISRPAVWAIIAANVGWTVASLALIVSGWVAPTLLGYLFVIVQAAAVAIFAELQLVGLRRHAAPA